MSFTWVRQVIWQFETNILHHSHTTIFIVYNFPFDDILYVELRQGVTGEHGTTASAVYLTLVQPLTTYLKISRMMLPELDTCYLHCCACVLCMDLEDENQIHLGMINNFPLFKQLIFEFKRVSALTGALVQIPNPDRVSLSQTDEEA